MNDKNIMRSRHKESREPKEYEERVIEVSRISRVVKGGRRIRFRVLVCIGNRNGKVAMGVAKANEVSIAVAKAVTQAKKNMINVPIIDGTIPHEISTKYAGAKIIMKPASEGTSIVAGGSVRIVAEMAGIRDLLAKRMGSANKVNNVRATIKALSSFSEEITEKVKIFSDRNAKRLADKSQSKSLEKPAEKTIERNKVSSEVEK